MGKGAEVLHEAHRNSSPHSTHTISKLQRNLKSFRKVIELVEVHMRVQEVEAHNVAATITMVKAEEAVVDTTLCLMEIPNTMKVKIMATVVSISLISLEVVVRNLGINLIIMETMIWAPEVTTLEVTEVTGAAEAAEVTEVIATKDRCSMVATVDP